MITDKSKNLGRTGKSPKPTVILMTNELQRAYDYFNDELFGGELSQCMLTVSVHRASTLGYFMPYSYVSLDGDFIHQIALNPEHLRTRSVLDSLSTLVHEQCHLWIFDILGRKSANGYHCKKWGAKMEEVGLIPSDTGKSGGCKTGYRMSHYIENGGLFEVACKSLIDSGFGISWAKASANMQAKALGLKVTPTASPLSTDKHKGKVRFKCPVCSNTCWAAPSRNLVCGDHLIRMKKDI